ncbi:MAG: O-antigen ligase family protein [Deltaproteobacteria bacterium]|nr:O-antigen ligase family protein [Deltaproteobacteria bacterium]
MRKIPYGNSTKQRQENAVIVSSLPTQGRLASFVSARQLRRLCDRVFISGLLFLILFTPLAFGAAHPWAFSLMEALIFLLVVVWMGKLLLGTKEQEDGKMEEGIAGRRLSRMFLPLAFFIGFVFFQLVPLPPALLFVLSPSTYELYTQTFPGWPDRVPYASIASVASDTSIASIATDAPVASVASTASIAKDETETASTPGPQSDTLHAPRSTLHALWRSLSLAPLLTFTNLFKFLAYTALLLLVLFYPFGSASRQQLALPSPPPSWGRTKERGNSLDPREAEMRFVRTVLLAILCTGLFIAVLGVVQEFTWNGKILWFFVPYDWGEPHPGLTPRASGPFVNPNHFANYLALIFPLAITGALSGGLLTLQRRRKTLSPSTSGAERIFCGFVVLTLTLAILLSLSRGGWIGTVVGMSILFWVSPSSPLERSPGVGCQPKRLIARFALPGCFLLLALALFFLGPAGRSQVDVRLEQTVTEDQGLEGRAAVWPSFLGMVRDFPLLGVGLGAWPELWPHYRQPPWSRGWYSEAHNDYVQVFAETGVLGFALLLWFFWQGGRRLYDGLWQASPGTFPVLAALLAALGTMAFHEFVDFNLQIPANAFLFTLLFGLALRLTESGVRRPASGVRRLFQVSVAVGVAVLALTLCLLAVRQGGPPYPYNIKDPDSPVEARELLLSYPARSSGHLALFLSQDEATPADQLQELEAGLWLDPLNPLIHDLYAAVLAEQGREDEAMQEMTRSVSLAPSFGAHLYLSGLQEEGPSSLSEAEAAAVEEGFKQALNSSYEGAVGGLGTFYTAVKHFAEAGKVYEDAAVREEESEVQLSYLLNAGLAYARTEEGGGREKAETLLRQAATIAPQDPRPYQYLAVQVFAPRGDVASAKAVIAEGIKNRADTLSLTLSLAEAAQKAGDRREARAALEKALAFKQSSFEANFRLGLFYLQEKNFDRAVLSLRKATDLRPNDASAFYQLGVAEEGRYQFFTAQKAYARAVQLAPDNTGFQSRYEALQRKVAEQKSP